MAHAHMVKIGVITAAAILCASCLFTERLRSVNPQLFDQAVPFCEMIKNKETFLGHEIFVRAFWVSNDHGSLIFDDDGNCQGSAWLRGTLDLKDDKRAARIVSQQLRRGHYPEVVLRGRLLKRSRCNINGVEGCFQYLFIDKQIVAARPGRPFHEL